MTTHDFLEALHAHPAADLEFTKREGTIAPGYHVTEIKAVTVRAVDCGGVSTRWSETVLQILPPARPDDRTMTVGAFLAIHERVARAVPIEPHAHLRVETPAADGVAIAYAVERVTVGSDRVSVHLLAPAAACKGADRSVGDLPVLGDDSAGGACCAPAPADRARAAACCA